MVSLLIGKTEKKKKKVVLLKLFEVWKLSLFNLLRFLLKDKALIVNLTLLNGNNISLYIILFCNQQH